MKLLSQAIVITSSMLCLSFVGWMFPLAGSAAALLLSAGIFALYFRAPWGAFLLVIAELVFGGKGWWLAFSWGGEAFPVRILLFVALFAAWGIHFFAERKSLHSLFSAIPKSLRAPLTFFFLIMIWGVIWGLGRGNGFGNVFLDGNGYGYYLMLFPLFSIVTDSRVRFSWDRILRAIGGAGMAGALFTLALYHVFAHQYPAAETLYHWVRDSLLGEITFIRPGAWRIFMQSQIWLLVIWTWAAVKMLMRQRLHTPPSFGRSLSRGESPPREGLRGGSPLRQNILNIIILLFSASALIISFSRSFWMGWGAIIAVFFGFLIIRFKKGVFKKEFILRVITMLAVSSIGGFLLSVAVQRIPPVPAGFPLKERLTEVAASSSRVNQLMPLWKGIAAHPLIGSGFGATVTYQSADPRVVMGTAGGTGTYTTYAFEWGYLDVWLKTGFVGLASLLALLWSIMRTLWHTMQRGEGREFLPAMVFLFSLLGLAVINIFSPYLNHPLGIGIIILAVAVCLSDAQGEKNVISPQII